MPREAPLHKNALDDFENRKPGCVYVYLVAGYNTVIIISKKPFNAWLIFTPINKNKFASEWECMG